MRLRKWCSNSSRLLETIDIQDRETSTETIIDDTQTIKNLGIYWDMKHHETTKREALSIISRVYDPLGWLSPVIVTLKVFMQSLWLRGVEWDSTLSEDLQTRSNLIYNNLEHIDQIQIPRWLGYATSVTADLHAFVDASEVAYVAAVYLKVTYENGKISTQLVASKSKVSPVKQITLPRVELCACQLAIRLLRKVQAALNKNSIQLQGWTVLAWLSDHPRRWKTFVANRTSNIISVLPRENWHHIASADNPVDIASREVTAHELQFKTLCWFGPSIL